MAVDGARCPHVALLRGERSNADPGGVRLHDPVHLAHVLRRHAQARTHTADRAVRRGHERVRPCNDTRARQSRQVCRAVGGCAKWDTGDILFVFAFLSSKIVRSLSYRFGNNASHNDAEPELHLIRVKSSVL